MPLPLDVHGSAQASVMRRLVEAMIFEGLVPAIAQGRDGSRFEWSVDGQRLRCEGRVSAFNRIRIDAGSIERFGQDDWEPVSLADLLACLQGPAGSKAALATELERTLAFCDWNERNIRPDIRRALPFSRLDGALDEGHPYHPCFKARTGFDDHDHARFGPEAGAAFQLEWLAIAPERLHATYATDPDAFWLQELGEATCASLDARRGAAARNFGLIPVHPWQWTALQASSLATWIAEGSAIHLGQAGDHYVASQSVRTLFNRDRSDRANIKLPMNLVNSSTMRIIEPHSVGSAPAISRWLKAIVADDPILTERYPMTVIGEYAGVIADRDGPLAGQLAAIWRESIEGHLLSGETAVPLNALMMIEADGRPFVADWIDRYGLQAWLAQLVDTVILPVCHLLAAHGVALEAHGQNLVLIHRDGWPVRLAVRDLHDSVEYVPDFIAAPDRVPDFLAMSPAYKAAAPNQFYWMESVDLLGELILDALFIYNMAEISHLLERFYGLDEAAFWKGVGQRLKAHALEHGLMERVDALGLLKSRIRTESLLSRKLATAGAECSHEVPNSLVAST
ncbi:IucA/IucC family protein [Mesorhizobium sp. CAU 1732]|uniref:IucA/IucC family protein n=1 Tax=Mesorhizobium sp. CAU 1732 TaxID=3140358 RepID=UPI00325FE081